MSLEAETASQNRVHDNKVIITIIFSTNIALQNLQHKSLLVFRFGFYFVGLDTLSTPHTFYWVPQNIEHNHL